MKKTIAAFLILGAFTFFAKKYLSL